MDISSTTPTKRQPLDDPEGNSDDDFDYAETDVFGSTADGPGGGDGGGGGSEVAQESEDATTRRRYAPKDGRQLGEGSVWKTNQDSRHLLDNRVKMELIFVIILGLVHAGMVVMASLNLYKTVPTAQHEVVIWTSGAVALIDLFLCWAVSHTIWATAFIATSAAFAQFCACSLGFANWNDAYWLLASGSLIVFFITSYTLLQMIIHHRLSSTTPEEDQTILHGLAGEERDDDLSDDELEDMTTTLDDEGVEKVEEFFDNVATIPMVWTYLCTEMEGRTCDPYSARKPCCVSSPEIGVWGLSSWLCVRLFLLSMAIPSWIQPDRYGVAGSRWVFVLAYALFFDLILAFIAGIPPWAFLGGATVTLAGAAQMAAVTSGGVGGGQAALMWLGAWCVLLAGFGIRELLLRIQLIQAVEVKVD